MTTIRQDSEQAPLLQSQPQQQQPESIVVVHRTNHAQDSPPPPVPVLEQESWRTKALQSHREMVQERYSFNWWKEWIIVLLVFSITGSTAARLTRPLLKYGFGIEGSFGQGPWLYRISYLILMFPFYTLLLLFFATLVGRRPYFHYVLVRMWSRVLPKKWMTHYQ